MRGPDALQVVETNFGYLGFARLAIMGLTPEGMQPFEQDGNWVVCNGEIYGFRTLKKELMERGYEFKSGSDCEVLLPVYKEYGLEMFSHLDAEFACVIYDAAEDKIIAAMHKNIILRLSLNEMNIKIPLPYILWKGDLKYELIINYLPKNRFVASLLPRCD